MSSEKVISPGVFTNEIDQTFLPAAIADIGAAIIGPTVKGPSMQPTVVNSYSDFVDRFGSTFRSGSDQYTYYTSLSAREYLKHGSKLTVVRVLAGSPTHATATISSSLNPSDVGGGSIPTGSFTIAAGAFGQGASPDSMSIGGVSFIFTGSGAGYTNSSTNLYVVSSSNVTTTAAEFAAVINNSSSLHRLNITASNTAGLLHLTSSLPGKLHAADGLSLVGGSQISGTLHLVSSSKTAYTSVNQLQGGSDYSNTFRESFKLHTLSDGEILNSVGPIVSNTMLKSGSKDNLKWEVSSVNYKKGTFSLLIRRGDDINNRKQILESWNNLSLDSNQNNFIGKRIGDQYYSLQSSGTNTPYLKLNGDNQVNSKYVRVEVLKQTVNYLDENGNVSVPDYSASLPAAFSGSNAGSFSGGTDGDVVHPKAFYQHVTSGSGNMQGLNLSSGNTGLTAYEDALNLLKNQDEFDINMILIPGIIDDVHTAIVTKAIQVCEDRGDCFLIIDPTGHAKNVTDATARATERDSNYAAMYWPWVKLFDSELGRHVWAPSSVSVAGVYSSNDKVAHPWYAPAGLNRGTIQNVSRAERKLRQADRDTLYESNVNPIASFPGQGVVVWGQKTLQKKASALDRVNVRRLMIKLKKFIASSTRFLVFEQNNIGTRQRFLNIVNPFMEQVQSQSGLNSFRVVMDSTNNTPDIVDRNILYGQIFVQPTRTAEFIILDFTIQPTGATFAA